MYMIVLFFVSNLPVAIESSTNSQYAVAVELPIIKDVNSFC